MGISYYLFQKKSLTNELWIWDGMGLSQNGAYPLKGEFDAEIEGKTAKAVKQSLAAKFGISRFKRSSSCKMSLLRLQMWQMMRFWLLRLRSTLSSWNFLHPMLNKGRG
jgi:hypothetical protein